MNKLRQVTRQVLVYLSTLSLGVIAFYRTSDKKVKQTFCAKFYLMGEGVVQSVPQAELSP